MLKRNANKKLTYKGEGSRISAKKPLLRRRRRKKRPEWALAHKDWTIESWKQVLWTDEYKFEVLGQKRRIYVGRGLFEKLHPGAITPTVKHGGGSVMV